MEPPHFLHRFYYSRECGENGEQITSLRWGNGWSVIARLRIQEKYFWLTSTEKMANQDYFSQFSSFFAISHLSPPSIPQWINVLNMGYETLILTRRVHQRLTRNIKIHANFRHLSINTVSSSVKSKRQFSKKNCVFWLANLLVHSILQSHQNQI